MHTTTHLFLAQDRRPRLTLRILLALLGFVGCLALSFVTVRAVTAAWNPAISYVLGGSCVAASTLGVVFLLRRHVDRRSWSGIGLPVDRTAVPRLLSGVVLAAAVTTAAGAVTVLLGFADWGWPAEVTKGVADAGLVTVIVMTVASTLLVQGFPEELVFRGSTYRNLGGSLPLWATVAGTSLIFGSIHVLSNGGASTIGERVLYAVMATGFGLMLAVCRAVSGTLWLGIGFHAGFDAFSGSFVTIHQGAFVPALMITLGSLVAGAAITVAVRQRLAPLAWRVVPGDA